MDIMEEGQQLCMHGPVFEETLKMWKGADRADRQVSR